MPKPGQSVPRPTATRENSLFEIVLLKKGLATASGLAPLLFVSGLVSKDMHKKDGFHKLGRESR
jgi:hypothetical protein